MLSDLLNKLNLKASSFNEDEKFALELKLKSLTYGNKEKLTPQDGNDTDAICRAKLKEAKPELEKIGALFDGKDKQVVSILDIKNQPTRVATSLLLQYGIRKDGGVLFLSKIKIEPLVLKVKKQVTHLPINIEAIKTKISSRDFALLFANSSLFKKEFASSEKTLYYVPSRALEWNINAYLSKEDPNISVLDIYNIIVKYCPAALIASQIKNYEEFQKYLGRRKVNFKGFLIGTKRGEVQTKASALKNVPQQEIDNIVEAMAKLMEEEKDEVDIAYLISKLEENGFKTSLPHLSPIFVKQILLDSGIFTSSRHLLIGLKKHTGARSLLADEIEEIILSSNSKTVTFAHIRNKLLESGRASHRSTIINSMLQNKNIIKTSKGYIVVDTHKDDPNV